MKKKASKNPAVMSHLDTKAFNKRYREVAEKRGIVIGRMSFGNAESRSKRNAKNAALRKGVE
tara:strand:- start:580 stop:765 length:186 start_codon:yes stop_codon:yes gene_type:complete